MSYPISEKQREIVILKRKMIRLMYMIEDAKESAKYSASDERRYANLFYVNTYMKAMLEGSKMLEKLENTQ